MSVPFWSLRFSSSNRRIASSNAPVRSDRLARADWAADMSVVPGSTSLIGLFLTIASSDLVASATAPVWPSSWAFQYWTILLSGSFRKRRLEVFDGLRGLTSLERELGLEHVAGRGFLPA